jgi:hypothetical protein
MGKDLNKTKDQDVEEDTEGVGVVEEVIDTAADPSEAKDLVTRIHRRMKTVKMNKAM